MKELITQLYPTYVDELMEGIRKLSEKYRPALQEAAGSGISQRDAILIAYGDSIQTPGEHPLRTLRKFSARFLKGKINAIHLLPCFPFTSDDGFSVVDYYRIDPALGNWEDVKELRKEFDLMFDAVVNHISQASDWFQAFLKDEPPYNEYFIEADPKADYSAVVRPRALPVLHAFDKNGEEVYVWTTFSKDQVDLNYKNHLVFLQVLDVLLFYASQGARFIRLDAIAFLWKRKGSSCIHLKETHLVIQAYRKVLDSLGGNTLLITETNVPHKENISYFGDGRNEAHMVYNFTLPPLLALAIHREDPSELVRWAKGLKLPGASVCFFNFTASHDGIGVRPLQGIVSPEEVGYLAEKAVAHGGFVSYKDNGDGTKSAYELNCNYMDLLTDPEEELPLRVSRFMLSQSVMLCMPGVPGIYYHSLLGSENDRESALSSGINRRINRAKLKHGELVKELEESGGLRNRVFKSYSKLLKIRAEEKLFQPFGTANYHQDGPVLIIERKEGRQTLYAVHNLSGKAYEMKSMCPQVIELVSERKFDETPWVLEPFGFLWLKRI